MSINCDPKNIDTKYLYYFFLTIKLGELSRATTVPSIRKSDVEDIFFPLPPLPEQHRIVTKIEELFTQLDAGVASLKKVQAQLLKRYRRAVLKAAFEGRLTQEWREEHKGEIEPASELIKKIKAEQQKSKDGKLKELPQIGDTDLLENLEGWASVRIGNIVEFLDHKRIPVNKEDRAKRRGNIPYYGANGRVDWIDDYIFDEPLVLVVEDETFVGRQIPFSYKITGKAWVNNHAHVLRSKNFVDIDFLNYSLMFYPFTQLTSGITGRRKLTKFSLINAPYNLPSKVEQLMIVSEIERHFSQIDHIENIIATSLRQAETLRQSILKQAFEGRLVPQDPTDEPASVLLERIKAEKVRHAAGTKKGKTLQPKSPKRKVRNVN